MSHRPVADALRTVVAERGWTPGTSLENRVIMAMRTFRPRPEQQYRAGKYRLDFAWPQVMIALEADGWYHRSPQGAASDRERDSWLRAHGWVILRVDDEHGDEALKTQVHRAVSIVTGELIAQRDAKPWRAGCDSGNL